MKHFIFPVLILSLLLSFSLLNSRFVGSEVDRWVGELEEAQRVSWQENFDLVSRLMENTYENWRSRQTYFHIVCVHEDLNAAESLFCRCLILSAEEDGTEFRSGVAELISQLNRLAEAEAVSIKNIL